MLMDKRQIHKIYEKKHSPNKLSSLCIQGYVQ